ncbi:MAG: YHYH protein [bacterium]|nr:YHYH protein [bacterium]
MKTRISSLPSFFIRPHLFVAVLFAVVATTSLARAEEPTPENFASIGGNWYRDTKSTGRYYFKDAGVFVDPFSRNFGDFDKDGTENLKISHDEKFLVMKTQNWPNHPTAIFPNTSNPNSIRVQDFTFRLPLKPRLAGKITRVPMGPIGVAVNGVVFFNPFEFGGMNAVEGYSEVWLDSCCGHPQQSGVYHYHKYPACVKSPFKDGGDGHSEIIGFAFDGFPLYGPYESESTMAKDLKGDAALDVCNGHKDAKRGYHYHVTPEKFPYLLGGYAGVVEVSNNRGLGRAQQGALKDTTQGKSDRVGKVITAVTPGAGEVGKKIRLTFKLDSSKVRRGGLPEGVPSWVQVGPFKGKKIERKGNLVTAEIVIPKEARPGDLLDCHIEFEPPSGKDIVLKKNLAFRVLPAE